MSESSRWPEVSRSSILHRIGGGGALGAGLAAVCFIFALLFLMMESHLLMMAAFSLMLLFYSGGISLGTILVDSLRLMYSEKHLEEKSSGILETVEELRKAVHAKVSGQPSSSHFHFARKSEINDCIEKFLSGKFPELNAKDFTNYLSIHFYADAHERYKFSAHCLDFVGNLMPLFGVAGTLYGMLPVLSAMKEGSDITAVSGGMAIAMNATLYGAAFAILFKVLSSRFKQRLQALAFQFEEASSLIRLLSRESSK